MSDHSREIAELRKDPWVESQLAADLLELHDRTGISLDQWENARAFIEPRIGVPITPNGA